MERTAYDHGGDEKQINLSNCARRDNGINRVLLLAYNGDGFISRSHRRLRGIYFTFCSHFALVAKISRGCNEQLSSEKLATSSKNWLRCVFLAAAKQIKQCHMIPY